MKYELIRIGIFSNPQEIGGHGATWHEYNSFNLLKINSTKKTL